LIIERITTALRQSDLVAAETGCAALVARGQDGEAAYLRGLIRAVAGRSAEALPLFDQARRSMPQRADIAHDHGVVLIGLGQRDAAQSAWRDTVALDPGRGGSWLNLALVSAELGGPAAAETVYQQALTHHPHNRELLYNLGNLMISDGRADPARTLLGRLVAHHPDYAPGWINLGMALAAPPADPQAAELCYRRAIALDQPDWTAQAWFNLGNLLLSCGRWADGFAAYEWRRRLPDAFAGPQAAPELTGPLPAGSRVLVWSDQGLGDAIQYLRHAPQLAARGVAVVALVPTALKSLAATAPGLATVLAPGDPIGTVAAQIPLGSLPFHLGLTDPFQPAPPYLFTPTPPPRREGGPRRVGLVWAGNPSHTFDHYRSINPDLLAPLLGCPGIAWVSLQTGAGHDRLAGSALAGSIEDAGPALVDLAATARLIGELDLVISVDTAVAHLAGALGKPVWILLSAHGTDWRWGTGGEHTALYPTARLIRQDGCRGWPGLVARLVDELTEWAAR
jgi:tetratricopeptide (TPR) repeat protein